MAGTKHWYYVECKGSNSGAQSSSGAVVPAGCGDDCASKGGDSGAQWLTLPGGAAILASLVLVLVLVL